MQVRRGSSTRPPVIQNVVNDPANPPRHSEQSEGSRPFSLGTSNHGILRHLRLLALPQCRLRACSATARETARLRKFRAAIFCRRQRWPGILRMTEAWCCPLGVRAQFPKGGNCALLTDRGGVQCGPPGRALFILRSEGN